MSKRSQVEPFPPHSQSISTHPTPSTKLYFFLAHIAVLAPNLFFWPLHCSTLAPIVLHTLIFVPSFIFPIDFVPNDGLSESRSHWIAFEFQESCKIQIATSAYYFSSIWLISTLMSANSFSGGGVMAIPTSEKCFWLVSDLGRFNKSNLSTRGIG